MDRAFAQVVEERADVAQPRDPKGVPAQDIRARRGIRGEKAGSLEGLDEFENRDPLGVQELTNPGRARGGDLFGRLRAEDREVDVVEQAQTARGAIERLEAKVVLIDDTRGAAERASNLLVAGRERIDLRADR